MRPHALLTLSASAALLTAGLVSFAVPAGAATTVEVGTAKELKAALTAAAPGQTIHLADGTYTGNFKAYTAGTAAAPITLTGSAGAVLSSSGGYGLYLDGASYWNVSGLTVTGGQKGIVTDTADHVVI
jgi:nitrous oxidase accessory protein NosD